MVPAAFVWLAALPLTPNGKVDRRALPAPETTQSDAGTLYIAPRTVVERQVAAIWEELLRVARVSVDDDFFALGGHSLLLAQLAAQLGLTFQREISLRTLFQSPTLAAMSAAITAAPPQVAVVAAPMTPLPLRSSPYLHYSTEPLATAIKAGRLAPVTAAALAYWPDALIAQHGLSPQWVRDELVHGRPTVASILDTAWGRIATILLPRLHSELYMDPTLPVAIGEALAFAGEIGAQSVSLTGLLPSATDYGRKLNQGLGARTTLPPITTGHAMTAAAVVLNVEQILHEARRTLAQERLVCLGLGSIGLSSLRLLLQVAPHPQTIMLCDLAAKLEQLQAIGCELVERYGFQGELQISPVQQELPPAVYTASLIIGATNVPDVLDVDRLLPGTLLVDDLGPHCFDPARAIARFAQQHDLLFTEGGAIQLPQPIHQTFYTPAAVANIFAASAHDNPQLMMGCVLSSLLRNED